jgi:hypothetical protein
LWKSCLDFEGDKKSWYDNVQETFSCVICQDLIQKPVTLPCVHNLCFGCLERSFRAGNFETFPLVMRVQAYLASNEGHLYILQHLYNCLSAFGKHVITVLDIIYFAYTLAHFRVDKHFNQKNFTRHVVFSRAKVYLSQSPFPSLIFNFMSHFI